MRQLEWGRSAQADVDEIVQWYADFNPDIVEKLIDAIERAPLLLLDHPQSGVPMRRGRLRKWLVRGTPLVLLYRAGTDVVEVRRLVDARSDWQRW